MRWRWIWFFSMALTLGLTGRMGWSEDAQPSKGPDSDKNQSRPLVKTSEIDPKAALDEALLLRDPFKSPDGLVRKAEITVSDLEKYPAEEFKLIGVITGPSRFRAIVQNPEGVTFFVTERMRFGNRRGVIREIRNDSLVVQEKTVNALGREETSENEIRLKEEKK